MERMLQDAFKNGTQADRSCMLILGRDGNCRTALTDRIEAMGHICLVTDSIHDAREMLESYDAIDVILIDGQIRNREAIGLIRESQNMRSWIRGVVWSDVLDPQLTVSAIRDGASDYLVLPADYERLESRLDQLLERVSSARDAEQKMSNLLDTCRELSASRDEMSEQVDVLCGDLASAYRSMRDQMSDAVMVSEFNTLISQELDVEDMLRTALEYMLRRLGPTNAVVYLPESPGRFGIGAYVNYDMTDRDPMPLYKALGNSICDSLRDEHSLVRYEDGGAWARANQIETELLDNSQIIAFACRSRGETLAVLTFFRDASSPFEDSIAGMLDSLRDALGAQLGRIVRIHRRGRDEWPSENAGETGLEFGQDAQADDHDGTEWGDMAA